MTTKPVFSDPRITAFIGFALSAISGTLSVIAWLLWQDMAVYVSTVPRHAVQGGMASSMNAPIMAVEFLAYAFGTPAFIGLAGLLMWKPSMITSWWTVAGWLCLVPTLLLVLTRFGFNLLR